MRSTWWLGKWRGIPIAVHWTVLLGLPWLYFFHVRSVLGIAVAFAAFLFLLLAHELGHAAVAMWRNVPVGDVQLFFIHGYCTHDEPYDEEDDVLIAWGGVGAQLVVLVVAIGAKALVATFSPVAAAVVAPLFRVLVETNLWIMVFNLIPVPPLDGAKAWRIIPLLRERFPQLSWAKIRKWRFGARERARDKQLEAESERIAGDIIEKLKKGK
jgi:stage IV sporulation protein FB